MNLLCATLLLATASAAAPLHVDGARIVDDAGRQVVLHGVNLVDKSAAWDHYAWAGEETFARMRGWGFNAVRLGFTWAGIEPQPGRYSENYLKELDKRVAWAGRHGLYVLLDMHQDLYGQQFSDGAPDWATLTDGAPHVKAGAVWSDAYFESAAVQRAFDNFWDNRPGPDGVGLQDHFARAWRHVAARYAGNPAVIGYDLLNEPFVGSAVLEAQAALAMGMGEVWAREHEAEAATPDRIVAMWSTPEGRQALLDATSKANAFGTVLERAEPVYGRFERERLVPMYRRVVAAIREVDERGLLFLEPSVSANVGIRTGLEPVSDADGARTTGQVYAPHIYDLLTDTPQVHLSDHSRLNLAMDRHLEAAARLGMPGVIGEWGAFYGAGPEVLGVARHLVGLFERHGWGDFYWSLERNLDQAAFFSALRRPYPMAVAGTLTECRTDFEGVTFRCAWKEDPKVTAPTLLYLPPTFAKFTPVLSPEGPCEVEAVNDSDGAVILRILPAGSAGERTLTLGPK